jgi:IS5 family transposase
VDKSKVHCLSDAGGRAVAFHLTPGEAADCKAYDELIDLPEQKPKALPADKAYDSDAIRADLKQRGIKAVIPPKANRTATIRYDKSFADNAIGSNASSDTSRSTGPSQRATTSSLKHSSACSLWLQPVTGSNLSTQPSF